MRSIAATRARSVRGHRDGAHSQGWCNYHEELPVLLDFPYVRGPRARELVYINNLQRAERISLGLKVLERRARRRSRRWTAMQKRCRRSAPASACGPEEAFEEIEGVIQRGLDHGMTGRLQIFQLLADRKMQLGDKFDFREFNDQIDQHGLGPARAAAVGDDGPGRRSQASLWKARAADHRALKSTCGDRRARGRLRSVVAG